MPSEKPIDSVAWLTATWTKAQATAKPTDAALLTKALANVAKEKPVTQADNVQVLLKAHGVTTEQWRQAAGLADKATLVGAPYLWPVTTN